MIESVRTRFWSPLIGAALVAALGYRIPVAVPDSEFYTAIAAGGQAGVPAPFAQRVGLPYSAHLVSGLGIPLPAAFVVLAVGCLLVFCLALRSLLRDLPDVGYLALLVVPFTVLTYREAYLPDLAFAAALAVLFLLLRASASPWWAVALIVPLFVIRESVLLVGLVIVVVYWRRGRRPVALGALATTVAGYLLSGALGAGGGGTQHGVGGSLYLLAKVPYNGLKNLTGFSVWTNDKPLCTPLLTGRLPAPVGAITEAGLCPFDGRYPAVTLVSWLTLFGVLPTVVVALRRRGSSEPWLRVALCTGGIAFVAAPLLGASVRRLAGHGWPALVLFGSAALVLHLGRRDGLRILALSFALCWLPVVLDTVLGGANGFVVTIVAAVPFHVAAARMVRRAAPAPTEPAPVSGQYS